MINPNVTFTFASIFLLGACCILCLAFIGALIKELINDNYFGTTISLFAMLILSAFIVFASCGIYALYYDYVTQYKQSTTSTMVIINDNY